MAKALPFPVHKHPPSTRDPRFMLRIGALTNDQGSEGAEPAESDSETDADAEGEGDGPPTEGGPGKY